MLTEEIKQRREKGRGREWQFEEKAARPAELEESVEVNKETLRSVLMISAKRHETESEEKTQNYLWDERKHTLFVCFGGGKVRKKGKKKDVKVG